MNGDLRVLTGWEVVRLLTRAGSNRVLLQVEVPVEDGTLSCVSRIHDVIDETGQFVIHSFGEGEADRAVASGAQLGITMMVDRLPYRFRTCCATGRAGIQYHVLRAPDQIEAVQRRSFYRVEPPSIWAVKASARYHDGDEPSEVRMLNLSMGGAMFLDVRLVSAPAIDHALALDMTFDDDRCMAVQARVRHCGRPPGEGRGLRMGVEFENLGPREQSALSQIVMRWQREKRRHETQELPARDAPPS